MGINGMNAIICIVLNIWNIGPKDPDMVPAIIILVIIVFPVMETPSYKASPYSSSSGATSGSASFGKRVPCKVFDSSTLPSTSVSVGSSTMSTTVSSGIS